jgi:predicted phosphodiesterase
MSLGDRSNRSQCSQCGSYVSQKFLRVFGNNDHEVAGCPNCTTMRELGNGVSATE